MKKASHLVLALSCVLLLACHKKPAETSSASTSAITVDPNSYMSTTPPNSTSTPTSASAHASNANNTSNASTAELSEEQKALEKKKALLEYATMEDRYINDSKGQWANGAKASSTFGEKNSSGPSASNLASNVKGTVDGKTWTNNNQDIGFDWLETSYEKPVNASEVRVVFESGSGVEAINKIEIQSTDGKWNTVWDGISDQRSDKRGNRTWFVRSFDRTSYKVQAVKISIANNMERGYKVIDAVQLVGD